MGMRAVCDPPLYIFMLIISQTKRSPISSNGHCWVHEEMGAEARRYCEFQTSWIFASHKETQISYHLPDTKRS